jgi:transposase
MERRQRGKYSREFKEDGVRLLENSGKRGPEVEEELGIGRGQIYRWKQRLEEEKRGIQAFPGKGNPRDLEIARLKRELAIVTGEREILRKAMAIFSKPKNRLTGL